MHPVMTSQNHTDSAPASPITAKVAEACATTEPLTKARNKALASVRWVLACENGFAALSGLQIIIVADISAAQVFDGRDNEEMKARFYSAATKTQFVPVLLP